ncbi:helix-turn-helix domain-containing protein [Streptomyces huiliensis]|uniref:helix-turn-helix domain-containing protein n=1 Tax=Streptomyces huiliensis TaxID=2876027 RepID=UPI001CBB1289|nr:helix-turn-helix transcriptional regulator [Streptomyces huiliensis]MBZ4321517.1 helix-turn-helix transcriptional regulator [Streptomyces huiliensis]
MPVETDVPDPLGSPLAFFGSELSRLRNAARLSQSRMARMARTTQPMISYVENAKRVPSEDLAKDLDLALGTGDHFARLFTLVVKFVYPGWFRSFIEFEREASAISAYASTLIPGLLQTEGYAHAILAGGRPYDIDHLVTARMSRQDVFDRPDRPLTWFIVDEYAISRMLTTPTVMRAQLERLLDAQDHPKTVIQVIPHDTPPHPGLAGPFINLNFDVGADVVHIDGFLQGRTALDPDEVSAAEHAYDLIRAVALSPQASADLIWRRRKELARA